MDKLHAMTTFVRVVEARSFSKAAETLSLPRSSVTTTVKQLEAYLGTPLLRRSTRSLSLTEAGERYLASCRAILGEIASAERALLSEAHAPRGRVRVDLPGVIGRACVLPRLAEFEARYPEIELVLGLSDRPADLIHEGIDCVIRTGELADSSLVARRLGELADSSLVARRLGELAWITCASPRYLERHGEPASIDALGEHRIVNYLSNATGRPLDWRFRVDGEARAMTLPSRYAVNETEAYLQCALEGLGLIQISAFAAAAYLRSGRLREVLADLRCASVPVSIVYPQARVNAAVRTFIDWVSSAVTADLAA
ncbi:LysR family transcriptional regulator [Burkholderia gladioli]|uniref:LysR family transcriptional regulator n=1 Tax=Burkholderia gladioli TaxID=28095 RepID=UPI001640C171|nr:LysR family transcriptional regulator [Burkholderia gladioli]